MLYQINDLRVVVETAKRLLTKEQMDKKSGQATTSPFMQTSQENSKSKSKAEKNEKKVSFSAVETIERTTDSIERLASLMDKMDTKLDRREDQYRPRIYQGRGRGHGYRQNNYMSRNRSYSRDWYQNNYRGRGNYNRGGNRNYRSNYWDSSRSRDRNNYKDGYRYNNRSNYRRDDSNQRYGNRKQDHGRSREGIEIEVIQENVPNPEVEINLGIRVEMVIGDRVKIILEIDLNQGHVPMLVQTGIDVGAIDAMSMITLQGNALMM